MTHYEMNDFIRVRNAVTTKPVEVVFKNGNHNFGYFLEFEEDCNSSNIWRFVPNNLSINYKETKSNEFTILINGEEVEKLIY